MDLYVLNRAGVPVRITAIRLLHEDPDLIAIVVSGERDRVRDIKGRRVFERVVRSGPEAARVYGVFDGATLRFVDRLDVTAGIMVDGDGDRVLVIHSLVN